MHSVQIQFQLCDANQCDQNVAWDYIQKHSFRMPRRNVFFFPSEQQEMNGLFEQLDLDFEYPIVDGQMMKARLLFEQGMLTSDLDATGFTKLFQM